VTAYTLGKHTLTAIIPRAYLNTEKHNASKWLPHSLGDQQSSAITTITNNDTNTSMLSKTALATLDHDHAAANGTSRSPRTSWKELTKTQSSIKPSSSISQHSHPLKVSPIPSQLISLIDSLCRVQSEATALRVLFQQKRKALSRLRTSIASRDEDLMAAIRTSSISGRSIRFEELLPLYGACQEARDDAGIVEDECEKMELDLDQLEFELSRKGKKISELYIQLDYDVTTEVPESDSGSSHISFETQSSVDQSEQFEDPFTSTETHVAGRVPDPSSSQIKSIQHDKLGLVAKPPIQFNTPTKRRTQLHEGIEDQSPLLNQRAPDLSKPPLWSLDVASGIDEQPQSDPGEELDGLSGGNIENISGVLLLDGTGESSMILRNYLTEFDNKHSRINFWLLHKLRTSPAEIIRLHKAITEQSSSIEDWETRSLDAWGHDYPTYSSASPTATMDSFNPTENVHQPPVIQPEANPPVSFRQEQRIFAHIIHDRRISVTSSAPAATSEDWWEPYPKHGKHLCDVDDIPYRSVTH
jgi:hypothetical protein